MELAVGVSRANQSRRPVDPAKKAEAVRLVVEEGLSCTAAGRLTGCCRTSIAVWVNAAGGHTRAVPASAAALEEARRLALCTATPTTVIAERTGVQPQTIQRWRRDEAQRRPGVAEQVEACVQADERERLAAVNADFLAALRQEALRGGRYEQQRAGERAQGPAAQVAG